MSHDTLDVLAHEILDCVCAALDAVAQEDLNYPGCPCRACVVAGQPAWDNCCHTCGDDVGGQLHVWVDPIYPYDQFPDQSTEVRGFKGCPPPKGTAVDVWVELVRCSPSPDDLGNPPDCDELEAVGRIVNIDLWTTFNAVTCCLPETGRRRRGRKFLIREAGVLEPEGGCVASRLRVTVDLQACPSCPEGSP